MKHCVNRYTVLAITNGNAVLFDMWHTFISARFGGVILWSSILISPGGILFKHC